MEKVLERLVELQAHVINLQKEVTQLNAMLVSVDTKHSHNTNVLVTILQNNGMVVPTNNVGVPNEKAESPAAPAVVAETESCANG